MTVREPVPFSLPDITDEEVDAAARVLRSGWITTGTECLALEHELAAYLDVSHVVAMSSCTAALETAYAYLGLPDGARVGIPTWTFVASALAPAKHGARPVLLDVEEDTLNLDPAALFAPPAALEAAIDRVLDEAGPEPGHVFNLGHGIEASTDPAQLARLVDHVHTRTAREVPA